MPIFSASHIHGNFAIEEGLRRTEPTERRAPTVVGADRVAAWRGYSGLS